MRCEDCSTDNQEAFCAESKGLIPYGPRKIYSKIMEVHVGLCCDCFDERMGMPEKYRLMPRPKK